MADHVFISYAHDDWDFVHALAARLKRRGVPIWIDDPGIRGGADWERTIEDTIAGCAHLLVVLSPAAAESEWVRLEMHAAHSRKKPILPVLHKECKIPFRLGLTQYIDYQERSPEDRRGLQEILHGLGLGPPPDGQSRSTLWADRWRELDLFEAMVAGESETRILLIESEGGMGKSTLIREYEQGCCGPDARCVSVDLKGGVGLVGVFAVLAQRVGWTHLPSFGAQVSEWAQDQGASASTSLLLGRAALQLALTVPDEAERRFRRTLLTELFFADLRAYSERLAFVFDTLNDADPEVEAWLLGPFLEFVRDNPDLVVVVAGRPPLEVRTTWAVCCERVRLEGIQDARAWRAGLHDRYPSIEVPLEYIEAFCLVYKGRPLDMGNALEIVVQSRGSAGPGRR